MNNIADYIEDYIKFSNIADYIEDYIKFSNTINKLDKKTSKSLKDLEKLENLMDLNSEIYNDVLATVNANELRPLINPFVPEDFKI